LKYLLDTNPIIISIKYGLKLKKADYLISVITEMELLSFSRLDKTEEVAIKDLLLMFENKQLEENIKNTAISLRKKYNLKLPDAIVAATAKENSAILVTSDKKLHKIDEIEAIEVTDLIKK